MMKLAAMTNTNKRSGGLDKAPPIFKPCEVWMVDSRSRNRECRPSICQMPEIAKNNNIGANTQPRYKWTERSFCMVSADTSTIKAAVQPIGP